MWGSGSAHQAMRPPRSAASIPRSRPPYPVHSDPITGPGVMAMGIVACGALITWIGVRFVWYFEVLTPPSSPAWSPWPVDSQGRPVPY
jgi:hypothetical protein